MPHQYEKNNGTPFLLNTIYSERYTEKNSDTVLKIQAVRMEYKFWQQNGANVHTAKKFNGCFMQHF